jgi:hypothetical protein
VKKNKVVGIVNKKDIRKNASGFYVGILIWLRAKAI